MRVDGQLMRADVLTRQLARSETRDVLRRRDAPRVHVPGFVVDLIDDALG
jgi:hypothetical protein